MATDRPAVVSKLEIPGDVRPADLDQFLDLLISGGSMDHALRKVQADGLVLRRFARQAGFPSRQPMRDARATLAELYPEITGRALAAAKTAHPAAQAALASEAPTPRPTTPALAPVTSPAPAVVSEDDDDPVPHAVLLKECVLDLARAARESGSKQLAAGADRLVKTHDGLVTGLRSRAADQAKEQRIAELQAELARLRGKSAATSTPAASTTPVRPGKLVRLWAAEEGIDCPTHGRIPARVQDAYDAAHEGR